MSTRKLYRKRPEYYVTAVQLNLEFDGFTYQKWGNEQTCKPGDWLVDNNDDVYTIHKEYFRDHYQKISPGVFERIGEIWAEVVLESGSVSTMEGSTAYDVGDYLVFDREEGGTGYAIRKHIFERMYVEVEEETLEKITVSIVKLFLASSSELKHDREEFEIFINRKNKEYIKKGLFFELVIWEDFLDAMSKTRLQDEYNKVITECDIFISLFHTKLGKYTEEEFIKAYEAFKANGKPLVYTYFKNAPVNMDTLSSEVVNLLKFKDRLMDLGHFITKYTDYSDLKYQFGEQLRKNYTSLTS